MEYQMMNDQPMSRAQRHQMTNGLTPTQIGVEIVQRMAQLGSTDYDDDLNTLHGVMSDFALAEIRETYEPFIKEQLCEWTVEDVTQERFENTAMAGAYWAATSLFFRKVFQAVAAAA